MTIVVRETKTVTVETSMVAITIEALRVFLRECHEAGLPPDTVIQVIAGQTERDLIVLHAERFDESDNLPREMAVTS